MADNIFDDQLDLQGSELAPQEQASAALTPAPDLTASQGPGDPVTPPKQKPLTYEEASAALDNMSRAKNQFYDTGILDPKTVPYEQTKKYLGSDYGYSQGWDNEDINAKDQSWYTEIPKAIGKFPLITLGKIGQQVGFTMGLINPVNWFDKDGVIAAAADNGMAKLFEGFEESVKHDFLPTFQEAADREKGFFSRAFTDLNFWTEDVADGAAFMASAFVPGMALAKMGTGMKFAKALSATRLGTGAAGKIVDGAEMTQKYLMNAQRVADTFDTATTWAMATAGEAMFEAKEVKENVLNSLQGKINPETGEVYTTAEMKTVAGGAARNTFLMNSALLGFTNAVQMKYLFKALNMGSASVGKISQKTLGETFEKTIPKTKVGKWLDTSYGSVLKGAAVGIGSEGYIEENTQLAIQRMNQEYGTLGKIAGLDEYYKLAGRVGQQTLDATKGDDTEAATSIGLGAILGGGMNTVGQVKGDKRDRLTTEMAVAKLNSAQDNWLKFGNIYETEEEVTTDETGQEVVIKKTKLDENNQPIVNQAKMAEAIAGMQNNMNMNDAADLMNDQNRSSYLKNLAFRDLVQAHIESDMSKGLLKKLNDVKKAKPEELAKMGFDPDSSEESIANQVENYKALAKQFIQQNELIEKSMLIDKRRPADEQARKSVLVDLATQQTLLKKQARDIENQTAEIKTALLSFDSGGLTDGAVDKYNFLQYRIKTLEETLDFLKTGGVQSNFEIKSAESLLKELETEKNKFVKDNKEAFEGLRENEDGSFQYENQERNDNPLNTAYQQKLMEQAGYENAARHKGLQFARLIDTKNGLKNFEEYVEDEIVTPLAELENQKDEEETPAPAAVTPGSTTADPASPADTVVPGAPPVVTPAPTTPAATTADVEENDIIEPTMGVDRVTNPPKLFPGETLLDEGKGGWFIVKRINDFLVMDSMRKDINKEDKNHPFLTLEGAERYREKLINQDISDQANVLKEFEFDGKILRKGQILIDTRHKNQNHWMVTTVGAPTLENKIPKIEIALLNPDRSLNGATRVIRDLKGYELKKKEKAEPTPNGKPYFKLRRVNEFTRIYPPNKDQKSLDQFLLNSSKLDVMNGLTMTVTRLEKPRTAFQVNGDPVTQSPNPYLFQAPDGLQVEIKHRGRVIGYLTNFDTYHVLDDNNNPISIESLNLNRFKQIFDTTGKDPNAAMVTFKEDYKKSKKLYTALYNILGKEKSVELDNTKTTELLNLNIGEGSYDYNDSTVVRLDDLEHKTINGHYYIINRARRYGKGFTYTETPIIVTSATGEERKQIQKEIEETRAAGSPTNDLLGRYTAVIKLPNGTLRFVELTTAPWEESRLEGLVQQINMRSALSKEKNLEEKEDKTKQVHGPQGWTTLTYIGSKDPKFNDELNDELAKTLFISVPITSKGSYIDFYVNAVGNLQIKIFQKVKNKDEKAILSIKESSDESTPLALKSIDDMIARINDAIDQHNKTTRTVENRITFKLTKENFKDAISDTAGVEDMRSMKTGLNPNISVNVALNANPNPAVEGYINLPKPEVVKAPAPVAPAPVKKPVVETPATGGGTVTVPKSKAELLAELQAAAVPMAQFKAQQQAGTTTSPPAAPAAPKSIQDKVPVAEINASGISMAEWDQYYGTTNGVMGTDKVYAGYHYNPIWAGLRAIAVRISNSPQPFMTWEQGGGNLEIYGWNENQIKLLNQLEGKSLERKINTLTKRAQGLESTDLLQNQVADAILAEFTDPVAFFNTATEMNYGGRASAATTSVPNVSEGLNPVPGSVDNTPPPPPVTKISSPRPPSQYQQLMQERQKYFDDLYKTLIGQGIKKQAARSQAEAAAVTKFDADIKKLKDTIKGSALKVVSRDNFTAGEVENIRKFKEWVRRNLPDFVSVEETEEFSQNMKENGGTVGMFVAYLEKLKNGNLKVKGKIRVGTQSAFKYHEAFHGVFRLLLTSAKQKQLLKIAKRETADIRRKNNQKLSEALGELKASHAIYKTMTPSELEDRYYEEYLADTFDTWKMNKKVNTSHVNKGVFAKIWDLITNLFKRITMSELEALFTDIDNGKYRHSKFEENEFTKPDALTITTPVMKAIQVDEIPILDENGNEVMIAKYLSQQEGDQIASTVSSLFHQRALSQPDGYNKKEILNDILNEYKELYDPDSSRYEDKFESMTDEQGDIFHAKLKERHKIFSEQSNRQTLIEAVDIHLNLMGFKQDLESDEYLESEDEFGSRVTVDNWKETHSIGGFGSLSQFLRQYIASTHYEYVDEFGNTQLKDGVPLIQAVNASMVYNGILKSVANIADAHKVMARLKLLNDNETQTGKFIAKFFADAGIEFHEDGTFYSTNPKQAQLITQVIKGFNQYSVDYLFINKDISSKKKVAHLMTANRRDAAKTQFSIWQNAYIQVFEDQVLRLTDSDDRKKFYESRTEALQDLYTLMDPTRAFTDEEWDAQARNISNQLKLDLGLSLAPLFVKHSLVAGKNVELLTPAQNLLLTAYEDTASMTREDVNQIMKSVLSGENPFAKNIELENNEPDEEKVDKSRDLGTGGVITRLNTIAKNNAVFDETVYSTSFKNADGELVYGHQLPTYHLVRVNQLNESGETDKLLQDAYLSSNFLLNSAEYQALQGYLRVSRIDGVKSSFLNKTEDGWAEDRSMTVNQNKGITYGKFSDREFMITLFDLYAHNKEYRTSEGRSFMTAQNLIRVLEASNTGDTINLPVIRAVQLNKAKEVELTDQVLDILTNEVRTEVERIARVREEIATNNYIDGQIDGYHYGTDDQGRRDFTKGRGLKLYKTALMVGKELEEEILADMESEDFNLDKYRAQLKSRLQTYWQGQIADTILTMEKQGIIRRVDTKANDGIKLAGDNEEVDTFTNVLMGDFISKGFIKEENGKKDGVPNEVKNAHLNLIPNAIEHNIAQVVMNNFVNTLSINQVLLGDQSRSLKDSVDEVKRARGANGSGPSLENFLLAPELGIHHMFLKSHVGLIEEPTYASTYAKGLGQKADGQMWMTVKGMRYTLHGLGKLTPAIAKILNKIERGVPLNEAEVFDYLQGQKTMFNSLKLVYHDQEIYLKTSVVMLTREFTSMKDKDGKWVAQAGREELHNMREKMEDFENRNQTVAFMAPKSASKKLKRNVAMDIASINDDTWSEQSTRFWRLQLENPSNKIIITDPTQAKQIIMGEQDEDLIVSFRGTDISIGELKKMYMVDVAQRAGNNFRTARNEIFTIEEAFNELSASMDLGKVKPELAKFQKKAIATLMSSGADSQILEFFSLDKNGEPKYNLNNPLTLDKYTQLFLAYFSKGVMSEKIPGHSVALMSNYGVRVMKRFTGKYDELGAPIGEVIRNDAYKKSPELYADAKRYDNDIDRKFTDLKEGDFYVDDLRHNVPEFDKNGNIIGHYTEFMMPPHFRQLMRLLPEDKINEILTRVLGVRIPSQDKHSLVSLKMVDFMPAYYGSTAIFPQELVEISGADFDIDKLYMHIVDTYLKDGKLVAFGTETSKEGQYEEYLQSLWKYNKDFKKRVKQLQREAGQPVEREEGEDDYAAFLEASVLDEGYDHVGEEDSLYPDNPEKMVADMIKSALDTRENGLFVQIALQEQRLPLSSDLYQKAKQEMGELNNGILNNKILDQKIRMLDNEFQTKSQDGSAPIAYEVASVDPLKDIVKELVNEFSDVKELMDIVQEGGVDGDSILGQWKSFRNNKEGSRNIAPAVNSLLGYSTLSGFKVKIREFSIRRWIDSKTQLEREEKERLYQIEYEGKTFDTYAPTLDGKTSLRAYNPKTGTFSGDRINGAMSTLASAMMDNAKERLAARLGLNIDAIGYVTNMIAQGMPLKSAIKFILQPVVREYFDQVKVLKNALKTPEEAQMTRGEVISALLNKYRPETEEGVDVDLLVDLNITEEALNDGLRGRLDPFGQYAMLKNFLAIKDQSDIYSDVSQVLKLTKGLGTSWESLDAIQKRITKLGLRLNDREFEETGLPFDLRQIFMGLDPKKPFHVFARDYIRMADQIEHLAKTVFIEKTKTFKRIVDVVMANLAVRRANMDKFKPQLKNDLISYLSIMSYMKTLVDNGNDGSLKSLKQALIYDAEADKDPEFMDILDHIKHIRTSLPDNYIANYFLNAISTQRTDNKGETAMNELNRDGINKLESNTWAKLSEYQVEKLRDSFIEIYQKDETRDSAVAMFNYLLVKDGGQFKSNSFIRFVPNFMFDGLLKSTEAVNDLLKIDPTEKNQEELDKKYEEVFGVKMVDLFNNFMKSYTSHITNAYNTHSIKKMGVSYNPSTITDRVKLHDPAKPDAEVMVFDPKNGTIKINLFGGIRKKEAFDTGTTDGIIYVNPSKDPYSAEEKSMVGKNIAYLKSRGFGQKYKTNEKGEVKGDGFFFPYVLRNTDSMMGTTSWYVLKSVGKVKSKPGDQAVPNRIINPGEVMANGTQAVYVKLEMKGSRRQFAAAEVIGQIPVLPKKPRVRKGIQENGRYGIDYVDYNASRSMEEIEAKYGLSPEDAVKKGSQPKKPVAPPNTVVVPLNPVEVLKTIFGIKVTVSSTGFTFAEGAWDTIPENIKPTLRLPNQVLDYFGYKSPAEDEGSFGPDLEPGEILEDYDQRTGLPIGMSASSSTIKSDSGIQFEEEPSDSYPERTRKNAAADATIVLASDFSSPGEKLTYGSVVSQGNKYIPLNISTVSQTVEHKSSNSPSRVVPTDNMGLQVTQARVDHIVNELNAKGAKSLNIAGNGIYSLTGYTQKQVDDFMYSLLKAVVESPNLATKITSIRSGGQTGIDEAGAKAGIKLGIPTTVLAPKGWKYRMKKGAENDISDERGFKARFGNVETVSKPAPVSKSTVRDDNGPAPQAPITSVDQAPLESEVQFMAGYLGQQAQKRGENVNMDLLNKLSAAFKNNNNPLKDDCA